VVARLSDTGRVRQPPSGFDDVESALLEWIARDPENRHQALSWLEYPPPPSADEQGLPSLPWALRELELRKPIDAALGISHEPPRIGFLRIDHYRWLPHPLERIRSLLGLSREIR